MSSFGEKLERERSSRDHSLELMTVKTGIGSGYLEALEKNDFDALPGPAFGKLYIRAYAEVLGFDPEPMIADYERELREHRTRAPSAERSDPGRARRLRREALLEAMKKDRGVEEAEPEPEPEPPETVAPEAISADPGLAAERSSEVPALDEPGPVPPAVSSWRKIWIALALVVIGVTIVGLWAYGSRQQTDEVDSVAVSSVQQDSRATLDEPVEVAAPPQATEPDDSTPPPRVESAVAPPPELPPAQEAVTSSSQLEVVDFGLGRRIVDKRLVDPTRSFAEGEAAVFSTRVVGGKSGESIRHVWLRDGGRVQSIPLQLGGSHWRTHSRKTLWGVGEWTVEARDGDGRVLASAAFTCRPR